MAGKKVHPNSVQGRKRKVVLRGNNVLSNTAKTIPAAGLENVNRRQGLSMGRQIQAPSGVGIALRGLGKAAGPVAAVIALTYTHRNGGRDACLTKRRFRVYKTA
jgi:hypothetical protein